MSALETETGQIQAQPTVEGQQDISDKDADLDNHSKKKERQINIGFCGPICLRLIILKMINICKEIGLMLLIAFTYAALTNDPPKISRSPSAYPFFSKGSLVNDYYRGELTKAIEQARQSDIAFVMFYAPWDAKSQEVRKEFELAAKYMRKLISFNAVNCWQPDGECRNHYTKVYTWPVLIVYPAHGRGIQYNGPKLALHMIRFLNSFMEPLVRVNNLEVQYLRQTYDAVVVANVNALPGSLDYSIIYTTALRHLETDPFQEVLFAINTEYSDSSQKLSLYTWNNTVIYIDGDWTVDSLLNWIQKNTFQISIWASPSGSKSQFLTYLIQPGPALILFTPRNPLYSSIDYYDLLHEVALQYYYCKNHSRHFGTYLLSLGIHYNRIDNYKKMKTICAFSPENTQIKNEHDFSSTVTYQNTNIWTNNSYCIPTLNKKNMCIKSDISHIIESKLGDEENVKYKRKFQEIFDKMANKNIEDKRKRNTWLDSDYILESYKNVYKTSMLTGLNDMKSPINLYKIKKQNKCRLKTIAEKYSPPLFSESIINGENVKVDVTGLACQANRSLTMVAMDSLEYHHFATSLSIDVLNKKHKTALVIVDEKMESHYVLDDIVTDISIREFIQNYSDNYLKRALITSFNKYNYSHTYTPIMDDVQHQNILRIPELNSLSFLPTVMQENKAVIVLYHSKQCSFCNGISYAFLTTAKAFYSVSNLQFARINGDLNTLPWEYTMESYPIILLFPDIKKSESRIFPKNTPVTVTNLVNFILSNLSPNLKLHGMWSLCNYTKFKEENKLCISNVRLETLSLIERNLKEWRMSDLRNKAVILDKLRELKHLHLLLAHLPANTNSIQKCMRRLQLRTSTSSIKKKAKSNINI